MGMGSEKRHGSKGNSVIVLDAAIMGGGRTGLVSELLPRMRTTLEMDSSAL